MHFDVRVERVNTVSPQSILDQDNNFCQLDKFGYSCYLFAGQCMEIIG